MTTPNPTHTPTPLSAERLAEYRALEQAAYPGPWSWRGNTEAHNLRLSSPNGGGMTVMDFVRYGMRDAQPRFAVDGLMNNAHDLVKYEVAAWSKDIYRKDISGIDHPDAEFIAAARTAVPELLAEVDRLKAERDEYCDRVDTLTAVAQGNKRHVRELYTDLQKATAERDELKARAESAEEKLSALAQVRVWRNEDDKGFLFADDIRPILLDARPANVVLPAKFVTDAMARIPDSLPVEDTEAGGR